ncbi:hypothetical protein FDT66_06955 [Polaribacter aestuariivivens]|uniref:Membrane or secreted protein n=1 Tax=Polaribacter aestuariivivens TaxID=2304626 RepID=A0A5S3NC14_9FLAO|nr:hypothetical protein [Polaribacter aestuariivivens]TMM30496.1 hypothetical protein FDT66_06955 [Polaribacter aestuariivivens]
MKYITKKRVVLFLLFIFPLFFYLILSSGINNFAKLPIITKNISDVSLIDESNSAKFAGNISIVCFLGEDIETIKGAIFNLNQKIYKPFYGFKNFQIIAIYPEDKKEEVKVLKSEIGAFTDMVKWKFVSSSKPAINALYESFKTTENLNNLQTSKAFIIDKEVNLRGRTDDEDFKDGKLFGYDMSSVAILNNKMKDDVKVLLAEYRLALKKNDADREI